MPDTQSHPQPDLAVMQQWTHAIGRAQQLMLEFWASQAGSEGAGATALQAFNPFQTLAQFWSDDSARKFADRQAQLLDQSIQMWNRFLSTGQAPPLADAADRDRRFNGDAWRAQPFFDLIRQSYLLIADHMLASVDDMEGLDPAQRQRLKFATRTAIEALSPANFAFTNPEVIEHAIESGGRNLVDGLQHMLADLARGQITQTTADAFAVGGNLAATPGKVVFENRLFQLIQYAPSTPDVHEIPIVIFPPWINRFYILDLGPQKSFVKWAVEQGLTIFVVSWKSADETLRDVTARDYVIEGQVKAIDVVRDLLGVPSVNAIGYCVAGTTLAMTLAWLAARGEAGKVASATFLTTQVDFEDAGDLKVFIDDDQLALASSLAENTGYLDGRYMAAVFNLLRGQDLIWNYVVNNYLMGKEYRPFDLLFWNSDVTNLPARWHHSYLADLYRDNKLARGEVSIDGTPIDLGRIQTSSYVQAGREDHIAPPRSVWKMTGILKGPLRFVLAGSGHIAGVINPPAAGKYQYWLNQGPAESLDDFIAGATEVGGSWWPDWLGWLDAFGGGTVKAKGARIPGKSRKYPAIEDAPGRYVKMR